MKLGNPLHIGMFKIFFSKELNNECVYGPREAAVKLLARREKGKLNEDEMYVTDGTERRIVRKHWGRLDFFMKMLKGK
jgi:hypothetical protein